MSKSFCVNLHLEMRHVSYFSLQVHVEGFPRKPDAVLNPKHKVFETVAPDLKTDANRVATYKGVALTVPGKGNVTSPSLTGVQIK